ncbi:GNAT family N-acetyltransferase [Dysgonomonas sp. 216]|uniref:GNAT family N-acetyltransferase n=1 Tax=Dysgonomonas sp. 216 TaxID=2302934 RepID=UPI0013D521D6|nr:GNAT family N-acetyltransferase [Dysgonomonas sp. 216]NDW18584.1 GNAT family N-acetyltransferase [Dysgonomonas sp. 216]
MNIINLNEENIATEHICCALDSKTSNSGVLAKKEWLNKRFKDGLRFKKLDARGKVFIEYIPIENAWVPVLGKNYYIINCHWVSGSYKGKGYGKALLDECENDAKINNVDGIVVIVGNKKKPFLSDKSFFLKQGYEVCDTAPPYFELLIKRFNNKAPLPHFSETAKQGMPRDIKGIDIFYTPQCPFSVPYIEILKPVILASDIPVRTHLITSKEEAQSHFCPVTTYSVFINGIFKTNEILTPAKLEKLLSVF